MRAEAVAGLNSQAVTVIGGGGSVTVTFAVAQIRFLRPQPVTVALPAMVEVYRPLASADPGPLTENTTASGFPQWVAVAEKLTYGATTIYGFQPESVNCLLLWGSNPATSRLSRWSGGTSSERQVQAKHASRPLSRRAR